MNDFLREFLTESAEHLETVDAELLRFELTGGVHLLDERLLVVLDVDALLAFGEPSHMAA